MARASVKVSVTRERGPVCSALLCSAPSLAAVRSAGQGKAPPYRHCGNMKPCCKAFCCPSLRRRRVRSVRYATAGRPLNVRTVLEGLRQSPDKESPLASRKEGTGSSYYASKFRRVRNEEVSQARPEAQFSLTYHTVRQSSVNT